MENSLQSVEESIAATWEHLDHQRHIIEVLQEHGHSDDLPTAEAMLQTLTASLEALCELKASLLEKSRQQSQGKTRLAWISK